MMMTGKTLAEQVEELRRRQEGGSSISRGHLQPLGSAFRDAAKELRPIYDAPEVPASDAFPADSCDICGGLGVIRYDVDYGHPAWGKLHPCPNQDCPKMQADRKHRAQAVLTTSGVPDRYREMTFETFFNLSEEARAGKQLAAACMFKMANCAADNFFFDLHSVVSELYPKEAGVYSRHPKNWVVLQGIYGVGKTGIAAAFSNYVAEDGIYPEYHRLDDLFQEIQSRYDGDPRDDPSAPKVSAKSILDMMCEARLLVLDDFNTHHVTPDRRTIVETLIRTRAAEKKATVITTNLSQSEFTQMWTERTSTIVREQAHWLIVGGPKLRRDDAPIESW